MGADLPLDDLQRRVARAIAGGRGMRLSEADLDLLAGCGALTFIEEAAEFERNPRDFPPLDHHQVCRHDGSTAVYFVQISDSGPVKIGTSVKPRQRVWELQISHPDQLALRGLIFGPASNERLLHRFYAREQIRGEWFRPSPRLKAFMAELGR